MSVVSLAVIVLTTCGYVLLCLLSSKHVLLVCLQIVDMLPSFYMQPQETTAPKLVITLLETYKTLIMLMTPNMHSLQLLLR